MDAFEQVVAEILWRDGYWVRTSFKVELTKEDKRKIELPSSPRWELDVVAYRAKDNDIKVVECKSYLDLPGVRLRGFDPEHTDAQHGSNCYRLVVSVQPACANSSHNRERAYRMPMCSYASPAAALLPIRIATAFGKHFAEQGWELWDEAWLRDRLKLMSEGGYENQVSAVVSKLLLRGKVE